MYSPSQTSEMLKIPTSTLRRYANQFADHLSEHAHSKILRAYTEQDIATIARARELLNQGKSPKQVNELLSVVSDEQQSPDKTLAMIPSISAALTEALDTARSLRADVDAMHADLAHQDERMSDTERKLAEITEQLANLERAAQTPWYRKIFKR